VPLCPFPRRFFHGTRTEAPALDVHPDRLLILGRNPGQVEAVPIQVGTHLLDELAHGGLGGADCTELLVGEVGGIDDQGRG
jgi:hypothetical protein